MANQERSWMSSPYHYCGRCGRRIHLADLRWQEGQLLCNWDYDSMLRGERELTIMRVLSTGEQREMAPDRKLTESNAGNLVDEVTLN